MYRMAIVVIGLCLVAGCDSDDRSSENASVRWVKVASVNTPEASGAGLSGTIRARYETPVSFQVGGRIASRLVDAGQRVEAGQVLFELDPRDLEQSVRVAQADLDAALAELETAAAETRRNRDLLAREFISDQAFERVELAEKASRERVDAARARLEQADNALDYASLTASAAGILLEVNGEPGQVIGQGQTVAMLADTGTREVELFLPEALGVPDTGRIVSPDHLTSPVTLREVAGAADPATRTWAARYSIDQPVGEMRLGSVVRVMLDFQSRAARILEVPIGAINERGEGPQVWQIVDGQAEPVPVELLAMDTETARILADLPDDAQVIALGTHLLERGMRVRPLEN